MAKLDLNTVLNKFICTDRQHHNLLEKQVSKGTLHRSQHRILLYIYKCKEAPTQKQIAEVFEISSAAVAVMLKKLESSGYIRRVAEKNDMRFNRVTVTGKGEKTLLETKTLVDEVDSYMFKNFSDNELEIFYNCLEKIQNNLSEFERKDSNNEKMV